MVSQALSFPTAKHFTLKVKTRDDSFFLLCEDLTQRKDDKYQLEAQNEKGKSIKHASGCYHLLRLERAKSSSGGLRLSTL